MQVTSKAMLTWILQRVLSKGRYTIFNFGTFMLKEKKGRKYRVVGQEIHTKDKKVLVFKPAKAINQMINEN